MKCFPTFGSTTSLFLLIWIESPSKLEMSLRFDRESVLRARERLGYGIEKTAEEAGVSKNSVLRAEHGEDIRPVTARKIAAALGVRVADLIRESETLKAQPPPSQGTLFNGGSDEERREPDLLSDARIREWLRDRGVLRGSMTDEEFSKHALTIDPEIDEEDIPQGVVRAQRDLAREADEARNLLWKQSSYKSLALLLPVSTGTSNAEQKGQRHEQLWKLRREIDRVYHRRALALGNYINRLIAEQEARGKDPGRFVPGPVAAIEAGRQRMWEEAFADAKAS